MNVYEKLAQGGYILRPASEDEDHKQVLQAGNLLYVSGHCRSEQGGSGFRGKVGHVHSPGEAREAARLCALNGLSVLHKHLGDLNRVRRLMKLLGFVASAPDFRQQPTVIDGAAEVFREILGKEGMGEHAAIAVNELPGDMTVEIECVFEIEPL